MRRLAVFITAILGIVLVVLLVLHFTAPKPTVLYQSKFQARNLRFANYSSGQKLRFFTGTAFAEYDLNTHTSTNLTGEFSLPAISAVKWSATAALIKVEGLSQSDELYPLAKSFNPMPTWWLVNFKTNSITPVTVKPDDQALAISGAIWASPDDSNQYYIIGQTSNSTDRKVIKIDRATNQSIVVYTDKTESGLSLIAPGSNNSILASTRAAIVSLSLSTDTIETLHKLTQPIQDSWLSADKSTIVYKYTQSQAKTPTSTLHRLDLVTRKDSKLLSTPTSSLTSLSGNQLIVISNQVDRFDLPNNLHQTSKLFESTDQLGQPTTAFVVPGSPTSEILVTGSKNDLAFLTSDREAAFKPDGVPLAVFGDKVLYFKNGYATYDLINNLLDIYIDPHPGITFDQQKTATITELKAKSVDPNQIIKHWHRLSQESD